MIPKKYQKYKPEYLAKGKRGEVYKLTIGKKEYVIKIERESSEAQNRIENEANFLKLLNKHKIGPKIKDSSRDFILMEFIKGDKIKDHLKQSKNKNKILKQILNQCYTLDKLKINKFEMHKPVKHILIYRNKATMLDFERCTYTDKPKNVTQFAEFINRLSKEHKDIKKISKTKLTTYKKDQTKKNFKELF